MTAVENGIDSETAHGGVCFMGSVKIGPEAVAMHLAEELGIPGALSDMQEQDSRLVMSIT